MVKAKIEKILLEKFNPQYLQVIDDSHKHAGHAGARDPASGGAGGGHYRVIIVASIFEGKKLIDRHRMIYEALKPVKDSIHALAIQALY